MVNNKVHFQDIIQGIGAGLCLLDKNFRILWINKCQSDWVGLPHDICGKYCYSIFEHRKHICLGCPTLRVFRTGKVQQAKRIGFTKNGQKRYYQLTVSPIKDNHNKVVYALELIQDITDSVIQERQKCKVDRKLKMMYLHLSSVNNRLRHNIQKLKTITHNLINHKSSLRQKYNHKKNELTKIKEELQDIFKVNHVLSASVNLEKIFSLITRLTCELMLTDACILRLLDEQKKALVVNSSYCISGAYLKKVHMLNLGDSISGRVAHTRKPIAVYDIDKDSRIAHQELLRKEGVKSALSIPILFHDKLLGVISTFSKKPRHFSKEEIEVLSIFASQVAMALQESKLYEDIHLNYFNTVHALVLAMEARDPYTRGHTERVTKYALDTAKRLNMPQEELEILRYGGEVHDIGKISIPDFILGKPGKLTPAERAVIELHPVKGAEMLEPLEFLRPALPVVRHHHERYDGTGYPDGLEKEKIPIMARILACADAFDAMTSERPYRRRRLSIGEAIVEIKNNFGSQFDPNIARLFIKTIQSQAPLKALS